MVAKKPEPVLLLHGVLMHNPAMWLIAWRLRQRGFAPILFDYASLRDSPTIAIERLAHRLNSVRAESVHVLAHSLGGLIAVETFNRYPELPRGRLLCLGSPLRGSSAACGLTRRDLGFLVGKSGDLLTRGVSQLPAGRDIGMISGTKPMGMGRFFTQFDGRHDGTVAVSETLMAGLSAHTQMPFNHTGLIFSAAVANQAAHFFEKGGFLP